MKSGSYSYFASRLRAQIGKLLDESDYKSVLGCKDLRELQVTLARTKYRELSFAKSIEELNDKLMYQFSETLDFIVDNIPLGKELIEEFRRVLGIWCISSAIKARIERSFTSEAMVIPPYRVKRSMLLKLPPLQATALLGVKLSEEEKRMMLEVEQAHGLHYYVVLKTVNSVRRLARGSSVNGGVDRLLAGLEKAAEDALSYYVTSSIKNTRYLRGIPSSLISKLVSRQVPEGDLGFLRRVRLVANIPLVSYPFQPSLALSMILLSWIECYNLNIAFIKLMRGIRGGEALKLMVM